ncbi:MAG: hypothetical protein GY824_21720, partial [Delftia sp.]|nr:hypothetical protein [Delftia sp.]
DYILAGNGLFKRARSAHVEALIPIAPVHVAGLPDLAPAVQVRPGRIPERFLHSILDDARRHAQAGREQLYQFSVADRRIRLVRPRQHATAGRVRYTLDDDQQSLLCDLHSHHTMRASFSSTDDSDELAFRFYAVIGDLLGKPEILLRLGVHGDFAYLPVTTLFTGPGPFADCFEEVFL